MGITLNQSLLISSSGQIRPDDAHYDN